MIDFLDRQLQFRSNQLLPRRIPFVLSRTQASGFVPPHNKYRPINTPSLEPVGDQKEKRSPQSTPSSGRILSGPKIAPLRVPLGWRDISPTGSGLKNLGNTCFMNSALQCLSYTPPLANLMKMNDHQSNCRACGFCVYCHMEKHVQAVFAKGRAHVTSPNAFVKNLKAISPSFRPRRQEDAHEFLRFVISGLQAKEIPKDKEEKLVKSEESDIFSIFGGYLRSEVHCFQCKNSSFTYEEFLDLSLEIANLNTVEKCLSHFTTPEILEKSNAYSCEQCKRLTKASKRFTIHSPPCVLVIQLKRFDLAASYTSFRWQKTRRIVKYPALLDLAPYMANSDKNGNIPTCLYHLYGVLIHDGPQMSSGHYYSMVKAPNSTWYTMDDERVTQSNIQEALRQEAYVLFYVRESSTPLPITQTSAPGGEHVPPTNGKNSENKNGNNQKRKIDNQENDNRPESGPLLKKLKVSHGGSDLIKKTDGINFSENGKTLPPKMTRNGFQKTISENFTKEESKNGNFLEVPKNGKSHEVPKNGKSPEVPKNGKSHDVPKNGKSHDVPKNGKSLEELKNESFLEVPKDGKSLTVSKNGNSPEEFENGKSPEEFNNEKLSEESKNGKFPEESKNGKFPEESKNGKSPEESKNGKSPELPKNGKSHEVPKNGKLENGSKTTLHTKIGNDSKNGNTENNSHTKNGSETKKESTKINFEFLQSLEQSEDIMSIPCWKVDSEYQSEIDKEKKEAMTMLQKHIDSLPKRKKRDQWDKELDQGRVKKVRNKKENQVSSVNKFQEKFKQILEKKEL